MTATRGILLPTHFAHDYEESPTVNGEYLASLGPVQWLWPPYIPRGELVVLAGQPGAGKTLTALAIAKALAKGVPFPDGHPSDKKGKVLFVDLETGEQGMGERVRGLGLDVENFIYSLLRPSENTRALLGDIDNLARQERVALLIVDSFFALSPSEHLNRADKAGPILIKLKSMANQLRSSIILLHHMTTKRRPIVGKPSLGEVLASTTITAIPRVILANWKVGEEYYLGVLKNNLDGSVVDLRLKLEDENVVAEGFAEKQQEIYRANCFLQELLADGPVPAKEVMAQAQAAGISQRTLNRAKKALGVGSAKRGDQWYWTR